MKKKKKTGIFHKLLLSFIEMALLLKGFINVITKLMCSNIVTSLIIYSLKKKKKKLILTNLYRL